MGVPFGRHRTAGRFSREVRPVTPSKKGIRFRIVLIVSFCASMAFFGCGRSEAPQPPALKPAVENASPAPAPEAPAARAEGPKLRVAIAAMISPKETFVSYKDLMNWIAARSGMEVEFVQRKKYEEINALLKADQLEMAFVCTGAYVEGHDDFGMEMLVVPVTQGRSVYYSYTIVPVDSPAKSFEDLKGKTFAFTDPMSNTGKLAPAYRLARMKTTPGEFFKSTTYTYSHDKSIESVARNLVDGAAVDSLVWDYMNRKNPEFTSRTRILSKSDPYGIPPVVVSRATSPELKRKLRDLFLHAHEDKEGREILSKIMIEKFVVADDRIYDSVRAMKKWVDRNGAK
jgi:phosphonate transport system substrate-binding protein